MAAPLAFPVLATGCATSDARRGTAGPISGEIVWDVPASPGEPRLHLAPARRYAVVLTETAGQRIELDYVEARVEGQQRVSNRIVTVRSTPVRRYLGVTLDPGGERRIQFELPADAVSVTEIFTSWRIEGTGPVRVEVRVRVPRQ